MITQRAGWPASTQGIVTSANIESLFWQPLHPRQAPVLPWLRLLFWLVRSLRPQRTLTLGLGNGAGHLALAQAMARTGGAACLGLGEAGPDLLALQERTYPALSRIAPLEPGGLSALIAGYAPDLVLIDRGELPGGPVPDIPAATLVLLGADDFPSDRQRIVLPDAQGPAPTIILSGHETAAPLLALRDACTDGVVPAPIAHLFRRDIVLDPPLKPAPSPEAQRLRRRLAEAETALQTARAGTQAAQAAARAAEERLDDMTKALQASRAEAQAARAAAAQASRRLDHLGGLLKAARGEARIAGASAAQTERRLEKTQEALAAARTATQTARTEASRLARRLAGAERAVDAAHAARTASAQEAVALRRQAATLAHDLAAARARIAEITASRSWRLTAPLRWLRRPRG